MNITQISFEGPEREKYDLEVTADVSPDENNAIIDYQLSGAAKLDARITFDFKQATMTMTGIEASAVAFVTCVTACGLGQLAQEIMDCWRQGHRSPKAMVNCLRQKGYNITRALVGCAIGCVAM